MAITAAERDILLKRLENARIAKIKKQDEAKAAKAAKAAPEPAPPAPAPASEPIPIPEPAPVSLEIQSPPSEPIPIPEPKKKAAKKVCLPISDDEDEEEEEKPKKKKVVAKKEQPYMKLKIYREPTNPQAFQSLLESIHNPPEYEDEPAPEPPAPVPFARPPRVLHSNQKQSVRPMIGADRKLEDARNMALAFFS